MKNNIPEYNQKDYARWQRLRNSQIWSEVVANLKPTLKEANDIINQLGADDGKKFTLRDVAIIKKKVIEALINMPDDQMQYFAGTGTAPTEDFDAFNDPFPLEKELEDELDEADK